MWYGYTVYTNSSVIYMKTFMYTMGFWAGHPHVSPPGKPPFGGWIMLWIIK